MTPLQIEILFHYYARPGDYRDGDFSAPAVRDDINRFRDVYGLLEAVKEQPETVSRTYKLTERGLAYIDALMAVPLPQRAWIIPAQQSACRIESAGAG